MVTDKFGKPVPGTHVLNRTHRAPFEKPVTIREEFPFLGMVSVKPGEVKEIPAEVAEIWADPNRWNRQNGWPTEEDDEGNIVTLSPIVKATPSAEAPVTEEKVVEKGAPKTPPTPPVVEVDDPAVKTVGIGIPRK